MALIQFTRTHQDQSTDNGYQFEFYCDRCGKFCPSCGKPLASGKFCTNCGAGLETGAKFCPECGTKQE